MPTKADTQQHLGVFGFSNLSPELTNRVLTVKPHHSQGQISDPPSYRSILFSFSLELQLPKTVAAFLLLFPIRTIVAKGLEVVSCSLLSAARANNKQHFFHEYILILEKEQNVLYQE